MPRSRQRTLSPARRRRRVEVAQSHGDAGIGACAWCGQTALRRDWARLYNSRWSPNFEEQALCRRCYRSAREQGRILSPAQQGARTRLRNRLARQSRWTTTTSTAGASLFSAASDPQVISYRWEAPDTHPPEPTFVEQVLRRGMEAEAARLTAAENAYRDARYGVTPSTERRIQELRERLMVERRRFDTAQARYRGAVETASDEVEF